MSANYVYFPCFTCIENGEESFPAITMYKFLINSKGIYEGKCCRGHELQFRVQGFTFEHLLSMAIEDFKHRDYRASVTNIAASMERFFAFVNDLLLREKGVDPEVRKLYFSFMTNRSERELAAFLTMYTMKFNCLPFTKSKFEDNAKFRNLVVHQGIIPNRKEAEKYCEYVVGLMQDVLAQVLENVSDELVQETKIENEIDRGLTRGVSCQSVISWSLQTPSEMENEKKLIKAGQNDPHHYSEMVARINGTNKQLWVDETGEIVLLAENEIPGREERKQYAGRRSFKEMIDRMSNEESYEIHHPIIQMPES